MQRYCFDKVKSTERERERERELTSSKRIVEVAKTTGKPWKRKKEEREGNVSLASERSNGEVWSVAIEVVREISFLKCMYLLSLGLSPASRFIFKAFVPLQTMGCNVYSIIQLKK